MQFIWKIKYIFRVSQNCIAELSKHSGEKEGKKFKQYFSNKGLANIINPTSFNMLFSLKLICKLLF